MQHEGSGRRDLRMSCDSYSAEQSALARSIFKSPAQNEAVNRKYTVIIIICTTLMKVTIGVVCNAPNV